MTSPYLCGRCARRLLRVPPQLRRASFVPLTNIPPLTDSIDALVDPTPKGFSNDGPVKSSIPPSQQHQRQQGTFDTDRFLELLTTADGNSRTQQPRSRYSGRPIAGPAAKPPPDQTPLIQRLQKLQTFLRWDATSIESVWHSCCKILQEESRDHLLSKEVRTHPAFDIFRDVLFAVVARDDFYIQGTRLSASDAISVYRRHGVMGKWWHRVFWIQLGGLVKLHERVEGENIDKENALQLRRKLMDVIQVWKLFTSTHAEKNTYRPSSFEVDPSATSYLEGDFTAKAHPERVATQALDHDKAWELPRIPDPGRDGVGIPKTLGERFRYLLPHIAQDDDFRSSAAAAVMTLHYIHSLKKENLLSPTQLRNMDPFTNFLEFLADKVKMDGISFQIYLKEVGLPAETVETAMARWSHSSVDLVRAAPSGTQSQDVIENSAVEALLKDLSNSAMRSDALKIGKLWEDAQSILEDGQVDEVSQKGLIFSRFLTAFFAVKQSVRAIQVWNHMVKAGQPIEQRHWNAMLSGCNLARDYVSLQKIWSNMSQTGVRADMENWATYIYGLIKCQKWRQGIDALDQLGREWRSSSTDPQSPKLTPSIGPVNSALSALIQINKTNLIPTVIAWARAHGLRPETYTYNILLRPLVRTANFKEIQSHLQSMSQDNCQPDITTLTIILNGLVSNADSPFATLPLQQQTSTITTILERMTTHGIQPTQKTYTTILSGLLSPSPNKTANPHAAHAILNHMHKRDIKPSSHIYTILMHHHFSSSPPDFSAIDSLWTTIKNTQRTGVDAVFYDRMIEGYAQCGEIEKALQFLRRMPDEGKAPSWVALGRLLEALTKAEEWEICGELVGDVEREGGLMRWGSGRGVGWEDFWERVEGLRRGRRIGWGGG